MQSNYTYWSAENTGWSRGQSWFASAVRFDSEAEAEEFVRDVKERTDADFDRYFDPLHNDPADRTLYRIVKVEIIRTENSCTTIETWRNL